MKSKRRDFLKTAMLAGGAATVVPVGVSCTRSKSKYHWADYSELDEVLEQAVLRKELFPSPVIIEKIELLRDRNNFLCRVRSKDGAEGVSVGHRFVSRNSYPVFENILIPYFTGKDARDLDELIYWISESSVKNQGAPFCVQLATLEFAILDMLGNIADLPSGRLLGDLRNREIRVYLGHLLRALRHEEPEVSLGMMYEDVQRTNVEAIKLRAGRGGNIASDKDTAPGRTEKLIRLAREMFGDDMVLMIDANGGYTVREAIRIGKILEEYNFYFYEEPVPWDWYQEQKMVEKALNIPMAGGEAEFGMHAFRYSVGNEVFQILQPDLYYFGGMIRTMKVARMAEHAGLRISPHITAGGLGFLYMLQMAAVCPALDRYSEFKMFETPDANRTTIPIEVKGGDKFESIDGVIKVPTGSGMGVTIDPDYINTHKVISSSS